MRCGSKTEIVNKKPIKKVKKKVQIAVENDQNLIQIARLLRATNHLNLASIRVRLSLANLNRASVAGSNRLLALQVIHRRANGSNRHVLACTDCRAFDNVDVERVWRLVIDRDCRHVARVLLAEDHLVDSFAVVVGVVVENEVRLSACTQRTAANLELVDRIRKLLNGASARLSDHRVRRSTFESECWRRDRRDERNEWGSSCCWRLRSSRCRTSCLLQ